MWFYIFSSYGPSAGTKIVYRRKDRLLPSAAALLIAFGGQVHAAEKIVISNWDGYMPKDLLERFTVDTGIEAGLSIHATNEEIMGKVTASGGKGYDVLFVSSIYAELLNKLGLIEPLDHVKIPNMENLYSEAMQRRTIREIDSQFPTPGARPVYATGPISSKRHPRAGMIFSRPPET
jgi:spermidine/putrescine-binding protein